MCVYTHIGTKAENIEFSKSIWYLTQLDASSMLNAVFWAKYPIFVNDIYWLVPFTFCCRCKLTSVFAEVDRILRPEGKLIVRDKVDIINEIESMAKSLQWEVRLTYSKNKEGLLCVQKSFWRPQEIESTPDSTNMAWNKPPFFVPLDIPHSVVGFPVVGFTLSLAASRCILLNFYSWHSAMRVVQFFFFFIRRKGKFGVILHKLQIM